MELSLFRRQLWNGLFLRRSTNSVVSGYLEEQGGRFGIGRGFRIGEGKLSLKGSLRYSYLKPYLGPKAGVTRGFLGELSVDAFYSYPWSKTVSSRWT